jgi:transcriptional regulator with XRE-family HTH domain
MKSRSILPVEQQVTKIATVIKQRRKLLRITQEDLAELSNISKRYLYAIEKGTANPSIKTLLTLFEILGIQMEVKIGPKHDRS